MSRLERLREELRFSVNFTQVGGFVQARDDNAFIFKLMWFAVFLAGFVYTGFSIIALYQDYTDYNVITTVKNEYQDKLEFPSVVICNSNRVHCGNLHEMIEKCHRVSRSSHPRPRLKQDPFFSRTTLAIAREFIAKSTSKLTVL